MIPILTKIAAVFLSILMMFTSSSPLTSYHVKDEDSLLLSFAAISDTHLQGNEQKQAKYLIRGLKDMKAASTKPDALIIAGDLTMNGQNIEYFFLNAAFAIDYKPENLILAAGNHDICIREDDYQKAESRFTSNYNKLTGRDIDKVYYATVIDGYYFLTLGSESIAGTEQTFSQAQLDWLRHMLSQAKLNSPDKPVFVINHNPLKGTNNVENIWPSGGTVGEQSDEIMNILQEHNNIIYFSGHLHATLDEHSLMQNGNVIFVNLPAFHERSDYGVGFVTEVYENELILRARNFIKSEWTDIEYVITLA